MSLPTYQSLVTKRWSLNGVSPCGLKCIPIISFYSNFTSNVPYIMYDLGMDTTRMSRLKILRTCQPQHDTPWRNDPKHAKLTLHLITDAYYVRPHLHHAFEALPYIPVTGVHWVMAGAYKFWATSFGAEHMTA